MSRVCRGLRHLVIILGVFAPALCPGNGRAQSVRGQLLELGSGTPVQGAMVLLLDRIQNVQSGFLSDAQGRYALPAPGPGAFTVRVERIGYASLSSSTFDLASGQSFEMDLYLSPAPFTLEGLEISGGRGCQIRPEEGLEVAKVWEEARKALSNQDRVSRGGALRYQVVRYRKELDLLGQEVKEESRAVASLVGQTPIRSLPADDLSENGYVRRVDGDTYDYFGPDAGVLLSDPFLDTHCFRLVEDREEPTMVGLAFQPARQRDLPDIEGTLWVDRESGALRLLEYAYTWVPWAEAQGVARGRVEFENLVSGAWVIRRWWIRMPVMVLDQAVRRLGGNGLRVGGIREEGGELTKVSYLKGGRIIDRVTTLQMGERPTPSFPPGDPKPPEG